MVRFVQVSPMFFHKYERIDATVFHGDLQAKDFFENAISMHEIKHAEVMYNVAYHDMTSRKNIKPFPKPKVLLFLHITSQIIIWTTYYLFDNFF